VAARIHEDPVLQRNRPAILGLDHVDAHVLHVLILDVDLLADLSPRLG
jgi:hypothetical protein